MDIATDLSPNEVWQALTAAYPGEGFSTYPAFDDDGPVEGSVGVVCDNEARSPKDLEDAIAAWSSGVLDRAKTAAIQALNLNRAARLGAFSYGGHTVPLDAATIANVTATVQGLTAAGSGTIAWELVDGVYLEWDLEDLEAFGAAAFVYVQACYATSKAITDEVMAAADSAALAAVDLNTGWPD